MWHCYRRETLDVTVAPWGYILPHPSDGTTCAFACCHRAGQMGEELNAMMNQGCTVLDVIDGPPICRQLTAHCGYPIGMSGSVCRPLQGEEGHPPIPIHRGMDLHTHLCPDPSAIDHMWVALKKLRFLFQYQ